MTKSTEAGVWSWWNMNNSHLVHWYTDIPHSFTCNYQQTQAHEPCCRADCPISGQEIPKQLSALDTWLGPRTPGGGWDVRCSKILFRIPWQKDPHSPKPPHSSSERPFLLLPALYFAEQRVNFCIQTDSPLYSPVTLSWCSTYSYQKQPTKVFIWGLCAKWKITLFE